MMLGDIVFLLGALLLLITTVRIVVRVLRRQWPEVRRLGARTGVAVALYLGIVVGVSLASPRRWIAVGEEQRFDDWCVTVTSVQRNQDGYRLGVRVTNRARGRPQRARDANLVLVAVDGHLYAPIDDGQSSLRVVLQPGQSLDVVLSYAVATDARIFGADVIHGAWPQWFIIGDRGSLLHKRPLVRLE